jgi:hypothetical protein
MSKNVDAAGSAGQHEVGVSLSSTPAACGTHWLSALGPRALVVLSVILTINNPLDTSRPLSSSEIVLYFRVLPLATTVLVGLWCVLIVARGVIDSTQWKPVPCEKCGAIISHPGTTAALLCARCRQRHLPVKQARKPGGRDAAVGLALLAVVAMIPGLIVGYLVGPPSA